MNMLFLKVLKKITWQACWKSLSQGMAPRHSLSACY